MKQKQLKRALVFAGMLLSEHTSKDGISRTSERYCLRIGGKIAKKRRRRNKIARLSRKRNWN
jgi:putative hemolysin